MFVQKVIENCLAEHERFNKGRSKEWFDPQYKRIGEYWKALGITRNGRTDITFKQKPNGDFALDANGQRIPIKNENPPWSAAFISFVALKAEAGPDFLYSPFHSKYILAALKAGKEANNTTAKWIARRRTNYKPKLGDLIACGREGAKKATFDDAETFADKDGFFASHTDFVIEVHADKVVTMGGNVRGHTVGKKNWPLSPSGRIQEHDPANRASNVICIIECRLT